MKVKLTEPQLIGTHSHDEGDVVDIEDRRARKLIGQGKAEQAHKDTPVTDIPEPSRKRLSAEDTGDQTTKKKSTKKKSTKKKSTKKSPAGDKSDDKDPDGSADDAKK